MSIDDMQFGFMPGKGPLMIFHHATGETQSKEEETVPTMGAPIYRFRQDSHADPLDGWRCAS